MIEPRETSEHGRIDALLPWFANGTLRNGERKAVERHLAECEECRRNLGVLERARARLAHETTVPILPEPPVEKFLETIDDKALPRRGFSARRGLAAAAGVVLLVSAAFFAGRTGAPDPASIYETATSGSSSAAIRQSSAAVSRSMAGSSRSSASGRRWCSTPT